MLIFRGRIRFGELRSRVDDPKFGPFREKVKQEVRFPFRKIFRTHIILFFCLNLVRNWACYIIPKKGTITPVSQAKRAEICGKWSPVESSGPLPPKWWYGFFVFFFL